MAELFKVPLVLTAQPEGGYTVTSPVLPELVTEGDTLDEVMTNAQDALEAVIEIYEYQGRALPADLLQDPQGTAICFESLLRRA